MGAANLLRNVAEETGAGGSEEFQLMVRNTRNILVPFMNAHLRAIYTASGRGLDEAEIRSFFDPLLEGAPL